MDEQSFSGRLACVARVRTCTFGDALHALKAHRRREGEDMLINRLLPSDNARFPDLDVGRVI